MKHLPYMTPGELAALYVLTQREIVCQFAPSAIRATLESKIGKDGATDFIRKVRLTLEPEPVPVSAGS